MKKTKKKLSKETKIAILKFFIFIFIIFCIFAVFVFFQGNRGRKLKNVTVEVQTEKLNNSIKIFKALEGSYPVLAGNENNLANVKTSKGVSFQEIYKDEKVFALPEDIKNKVEETNAISLVKDETGGWYYDMVKGTMEANLPEKAYK
jgi:hypothetical protein